PRFSELGPATDVGFGVPDAEGTGDTAGGGGVVAACASAGVAIGLAGSGFFDARSGRVSCIARSIGIRATPFPLSTQAYEFKSLDAASRIVFNFSSRPFARFSS